VNRHFSDRADDLPFEQANSTAARNAQPARRLLVVGAESTVGANIASEAARQHQVLALTANRRVLLQGCQMLPLMSAASPAALLDEVQPDAIIHCGPASRSAWDTTPRTDLDESLAADAAEWAAAAHGQDCHFTFVSSDAVFTGPWMFHDETSECRCPTAEAAILRDAETQVGCCCPGALIIRTNAYGWAPAGTAGGWIEQILIDLERRSLQGYDYIRHATPILATDLADILLRAIAEDLGGVHHVAGAERVNPLQFAQRLADHFEMPWLAVRRAEETLNEPAVGFGAGETSLQTKKVRKALCVAMPMLSEGLERLRRQQFTSVADQTGPDTPVAIRQSA
jgi:dTDP-4-dehydrorhamnose reductase